MLTVTDHMFLVPKRALSMDISRLQEDLAGLDFDARLLQVAPMGNVWISGSRPSSAAREDRETRLRNLKEKQNEERQKKLEEIKAQALAAQRYKEQKEQERRLRLEELRYREDARRAQVEERKRAINEAERDRLESILRRNQEREARIEARKRNDRSSNVFAFGSSTPRMLEPVESMTSSFWGHRRATSTQNITCTAAPLTRRQSERELDGGSKKRATSAGGLERSGEGEGTPPQTPAGCASGYVGRRRTDLMPTIPSKDSPSSGNRKPFTRSPAPSRPSSSLSQQSTSSVTSSVNMRTRPVAAPRRPRPVSIAVTGVTTDRSSPLVDRNTKPPLPKSRKSSLVKSQEKLKKKAGSPTDGPPKSVLSPSAANPPALPADTKPVVKVEPVVKKEDVIEESSNNTEMLVDVDVPVNQLIDVTSSETKEEPTAAVAPTEPPKEETRQSQDNNAASVAAEPKLPDESKSNLLEDDNGDMTDMSASMTRVRITTEEEAKAALAERRRLAREEAERQAEAERLRIEEEARIEFERQQKEEENVRMLIEQMKAAEEERLEEAIREAARQQEEERLRKEEENRQKLLKEEADRKAREEAERQKAELQERLKHEEKEREARRKRVEAIMLRTRGKTNSTQQPQEEKNEENNSDKLNGSKSEASENGHKNGKEIETVDNIIPVESLKNANTVNDTLSTDDTLNSNNAWQRNTQTDLLM